MAWDVSRRVFLRGAGLAAVGIGFAPSSLLVRTAHGRGRRRRCWSRSSCAAAPTGSTSACPTATPTTTTCAAASRCRVRARAAGSSTSTATSACTPSSRRSSRSSATAASPSCTRSATRRSPARTSTPRTSWSRGRRATSRRRRLARPRDRRRSRGARSRRPSRSRRSSCARSSGPSRCWSPRTLATFDLRARNWRAEAETLLRAMYQADPTAGRDRRAARRSRPSTPCCARRRSRPPPANGARLPAGNIGQRRCGRRRGLIKNGVGTRCVYVNVAGGVRHALEPARRATSTTIGRSARRSPRSPPTSAACSTTWCVMVTTEFGRTARVNGSAGTDHGSGYCDARARAAACAAGACSAAGRGSRASQLYQNRDLAATTDFRDVFQEVARAQFGISGLALPGLHAGSRSRRRLSSPPTERTSP